MDSGIIQLCPHWELLFIQLYPCCEKKKTIKLLKTKKDHFLKMFSIFSLIVLRISFGSMNSKKYFEQVQLVSTQNFCSNTRVSDDMAQNSII